MCHIYFPKLGTVQLQSEDITVYIKEVGIYVQEVLDYDLRELGSKTEKVP